VKLRILLIASLCAVAVGFSTPKASADASCVSGAVTFATSGTDVTATFNVVAPGCQVSMIGISYFGGPTTVVDTDTGTFGVGTQHLTVHLPCGTNTEADVILGPPGAVPGDIYDFDNPPKVDLGDREFQFSCPAPLTQGYWKTHASAWPTQTLTLGGVSYTQSQLLGLLDTPPRGNATIILVYQLIAAKLNTFNSAPNCATSTIAAADAWLAANGGATGTVRSATTAGQTAVSLANTLDSYNNARLC